VFGIEDNPILQPGRPMGKPKGRKKGDGQPSIWDGVDRLQVAWDDAKLTLMAAGHSSKVSFFDADRRIVLAQHPTFAIRVSINPPNSNGTLAVRYTPEKLSADNMWTPAPRKRGTTGCSMLKDAWAHVCNTIAKAEQKQHRLDDDKAAIEALREVVRAYCPEARVTCIRPGGRSFTAVLIALDKSNTVALSLKNNKVDRMKWLCCSIRFDAQKLGLARTLNALKGLSTANIEPAISDMLTK
jgi:hypothetical protein